MKAKILLLFGIFLLFFKPGLCGKKEISMLESMMEVVNATHDLVKKDDRLTEIREMIRIDTILRNIEKRLDDIVANFVVDRSRAIEGSTGDVQNSLDTIHRKLGLLETHLVTEKNVSKLIAVEEEVKKLDIVQKLLNEVDIKLRKSLNVIVDVHKDMKSKAQQASTTQEIVLPTEKKETCKGSSVESSLFFSELVEELEKKITRQLEKAAADIQESQTVHWRRMEDRITQLESRLNLNLPSSTSVTSTPEDVDYDLYPGERSRSGGKSRKVEQLFNTLEENLSRSQRDLKVDLLREVEGVSNQLNLIESSLAEKNMTCRVKKEVEAQVPVQEIEPREIKRDCVSESSLAAPRSCAELRKDGVTCDGSYVVIPRGARAMKVYCDMTTEGGGWTVLMRRKPQALQLNFNQNFDAYKYGFGDETSEFWLGNDHMHYITAGEKLQLLVEFSTFTGENYKLIYDGFNVSSESDSYKLFVGQYTGQHQYLGHSLKHHSGRGFSTYDKNNDSSGQNCAIKYRAGWWFAHCHYTLLTATYFNESDKNRSSWDGIQWHSWKKGQVLKSVEMKIRPKDF